MIPQDFGRLDAKRLNLSVNAVNDRNRRELMPRHHAKAEPGVLLNFLLEILGERLVAFHRDDGQRVDLEAAQALTVLVDAEAQTAADGLTLYRTRFLGHKFGLRGLS